MSTAPYIGEIPGTPPGTLFRTRLELSRSGVHRPMRRGIGGNPVDGASSILLSGVYEDDIDRGDEIIYTGQGARDRESGQQIADQDATPGNLALVRSAQTGLPVRVVRSSGLKSSYGPAEGYRYDGLYHVEDHWTETGRSGFVVWRFLLKRVNDTRVNGSRSRRFALWHPGFPAIGTGKSPTTTLRTFFFMFASN